MRRCPAPVSRTQMNPKSERGEIIDGHPMANRAEPRATAAEE
jgi:hypothetical protein